MTICYTLFFFWVIKDFVSCLDVKKPVSMTVNLGESITLNCVYNCSGGFVRGCWKTTSESSQCLGSPETSLDICAVSLHLSNVSTEDLRKNYTCYTIHTDHVHLPHKTERFVSLHLPVKTTELNITETAKAETKNEYPPVKPDDSSGGEFTGIKILATVTVAVALVLAALAVYLCVSRQSCKCKAGEVLQSGSSSPLPPRSVFSSVNGPVSTQSDRVTLRIPTPENDSDTEVPYADIMITVRGSSTPELTQVGYLCPGDQKERWGDESRCHLQASRSADRLHVPLPREVSRKMSTNSEYAIITYS